MAFNGSGVFERIYRWVVQAGINGGIISSSQMDEEFDGIATALSNCLTKDGQNAPTADFPLNGNKIVNAGGATKIDEYITARQFREKSFCYFVATGTANALVISPNPTITALPAGTTLLFKAIANNTGVSTLKVGGFDAISIRLATGVELSGGEILQGGIYAITHDGTFWLLQNSSKVDGGNAATAENADKADNINIPQNNSSDETLYPTFVNNTAIGYKALSVDGDIYYDAVAKILRVPIFRGALNGNADTATDATNATNATNAISASSAAVSGSCSGNASTATALQTPRQINGVNFNGTSNITVEPQVDRDDSANANRYLTFVDDANAGKKRLNIDTNLRYNPSTNTLFINTNGTHTGNASGATADYTNVEADNLTVNGQAINALIDSRINNQVGNRQVWVPSGVTSVNEAYYIKNGNQVTVVFDVVLTSDNTIGSLPFAPTSEVAFVVRNTFGSAVGTVENGYDFARINEGSSTITIDHTANGDGDTIRGCVTYII